MNKTLVISWHEFRRTIRRTGFIILSLSLPVIALLGLAALHIASNAARPSAEVTRVGYVDELGGFDQFTSRGDLTLVRFDTAEMATQALLQQDVKEYFVIPPDFVSTGVVNRFVAQREFVPPQGTMVAIKDFLTGNMLAGKVPSSVIARVEAPVNVITTTLTPTGEVAPQQGGYANFIIPGIFSFLLALALIITSTYVLQGLAEEKENRLMEILLSSVSTRQLLAGKLLGLGAAGLAQVMVWVVSLPLLLNLASSAIGGFVSNIQIPPGFLAFGVAYFILGYSMFAVLSAGDAAISSTVHEAQGVSSLYTLFAMAPFWFVSLLLLFPHSPVWVIFSIVPFTAPVVVMLRLGLTGVPAWQLAASMAVLVLCIGGGLLLASRLLRAYLLMYGKRPGLGQIVRALRAG